MNKDFVSRPLRRALNARCPGWARVLLAVVATVIFAFFAHEARFAKMDDYADFRHAEILTITTVAFAAVFAASAAVQMRAGRSLPLGALAGWLFSLKTASIWPGMPHYFEVPWRVVAEGTAGALLFVLIVAVPTALVLVGRRRG